MDECYLEHAERLARAEVEEGLARAQEAARRQTTPEDWDGCCIECGDEVPAERVALTGSVLCVECKAFHERPRR